MGAAERLKDVGGSDDPVASFALASGRDQRANVRVNRGKWTAHKIAALVLRRRRVGGCTHPGLWPGNLPKLSWRNGSGTLGLLRSDRPQLNQQAVIFVSYRSSELSFRIHKWFGCRAKNLTVPKQISPLFDSFHDL